MENYNSKFDSFKNETISKNKQKAIRGGDGEPINPPPVDPSKAGGGAGNT